MATFLDITGLEYFSTIFSMIFIVVVLYALFEKMKFLQDNKFIHATLAFSVGFILLLSKTALAVVQAMVPWFSLLFVFIIMMIFMYRILGIKEDDITKEAKSSTVVIWVIIISVIILLGAFSTVFGQELLTQTDSGVPIRNASQGDVGTDDFQNNVTQTLFHPKLLGLILILMIAAITIKMMASDKP